MTIKAQLHELIRQRGYITLNELEVFCHQIKCKLATAERELRPSKSPEIESIRNNGAIIGYQWKETSDNVKDFLEKWPSRPAISPLASRGLPPVDLTRLF